MNETVVCRSLNNEQIPLASANFRRAERSRYVASRVTRADNTREMKGEIATKRRVLSPPSRSTRSDDKSLVWGMLVTAERFRAALFLSCVTARYRIAPVLPFNELWHRRDAACVEPATRERSEAATREHRQLLSTLRHCLRCSPAKISYRS